MVALNTILLLLALVAFVMYLKNLFDIREGVLSDSRSRNRRRCPGGYKKIRGFFKFIKNATLKREDKLLRI
tara:strand:+ start:785 stop:997 length:213 start_codon:yes stop_codon:yes gene_type:complete